MTTSTASVAVTQGLSLVKLRDGLTAVSIIVSFFVMVEPSPNELVVAIGSLILLATGISFPRLAVPLIWMLLGLNLGGAMSAVPVLSKDKVLLFVIISLFLMVYCLYFVVLLSENTERRFIILGRAWTIAAVIAALCGIAGYFNIAGTRDLFTLYATRAKGTFNDPNVFGPFLILPIVLLVQSLLTRCTRRPFWATLACAVLMLGLFLSFSRAAWVHGVVSLALMAGLVVVTSPSGWLRTRILTVGCIGIVTVAISLAAIASVPAVRDVLAQRASLNQDYDVRAGGRFDNLRRAADLILEHPNGIGPHEFGRRFGEDPHNAYIHTFVAYGWLGGLSYLALVLSTLWIGWRTVWKRTPLQPMVIATVATFTALAGIGLVIHSDHWRHFFLLVAMIWVLADATARRLRCGGTPG